jgi:hypothetical protein
VSLRFTAKGPVDNLNMTVNLTGGDLAIAYGELFSKPAGRALTVDGHGAVRNQSDVKIDSLRIALDPMTLNAKGNVKDAAGAGNVDLRAWADPFSVEPLADMIPMLKEYKLSGKTGFDVSVKGSIDQPKILGSAAIQGVGVVPADGVSLSALVGTMRFTADSVATDDLKGKFNGSDFSVKARVENFERPSVTLEGELAQLDVGALMKAVEKPGAAGGGGPAAAPPAVPGPAPVAHTRGTFRVGSIVHPNYTGRRFRFIWELSEVGPDMGRAGGTAEFSAADGKIHDLPLAAKLNKLIKRDASEIPYDSMSAHFTITRGVLETPDFTAKGPYADMTAAGTVHLVTLMADLRLVVKIPEGSVGGSAAEWFAGEDGRPTLEATVRGPVSDPAIQVDLSKAAKRAAEEAARKGLEKLKEKFGGPSEGSGEEPTKQEKQIDKAVEEGKKALDKIFKRKR